MRGAGRMMYYYLSPYIGSGKIIPDPKAPGGARDDRFRPLIASQPTWHAIDLRPDCTRLDGWALCAVPERPAATDLARMHALGEDLDAPSAAVRTGLGNRLGLTLEGGRLRHIVPELLLQHAREDGTRWKPIRPTHRRRYEIWLGGTEPLWAMPVLSGGSSIADPFAVDGDLAGSGPSWTWSEFVGTAWIISGGRAVLTGQVAENAARADSDLVTDDHYAQVTLSSISADAEQNTQGGVLCRKDATATQTYYLFRAVAALVAAAQVYDLGKAVGGVQTSLGSDATAPANGHVLRLDCSGSTITAKRNGVIVIGPVTDTAITGNLRTGLWGYSATSVPPATDSRVELDDFSAGDLSFPQTLLPTALDSAEAFGAAQLNLLLTAAGIGTAEAFGVAKLLLTIAASGIGSAEAFGVAQLNLLLRAIAIETAAALGGPVVLPGAVTIAPNGIATLEAFGVTIVWTPGGVLQVFSATGRRFVFDAKTRTFTVAATSRKFVFPA